MMLNQKTPKLVPGCDLVFPYKDPLTPTLVHQDNISKDQLEPQQIASGQFNSNG